MAGTRPAHLWLSGALAAAALLQQRPVAAEFDSCTTIGVTAGASSDGSTMVTHTSDCAQCDSRVAYIPPRAWPAGTMRPVYLAKLEYPREVSERSETYYPVDGQAASEPTGYIPEVPQTYGYWEALYGYMNEHGLSLGESTSAANFPVNRTNLTALMWIRPLTQLAMERCKTARCAVDTMGGLAERYGFYGEDPGASGAGECLTIGDGKEVWVFEITGDPTGRSAFWAAKRVPEGHVVVIGNNFVIREVDCNDKENYRCSTDLLAKAKAAGAWDGAGAFNWQRSMGPDIRHFSYTPGFSPIPMYTTARLWRVFSRVAPSMGLRLTNDPYELPFSVRSEHPISHRQLMDLKRDHYEGTEIDLTVGPMAGPFGSPNRVEGGAGLQASGGQFARAISLPRTSYCTVGHSFGERSSGSLNKMWFCSDAPASSVFVPFYANTSSFAASYRTGKMAEYDDRSAWWVFDFVANWMDINFRLMSVDVAAKVKELQDMVDERRAAAESAAAEHLQSGRSDEAFSLLGEFQEGLQGHVVDTWRKFGHFLIMKYNDGKLNYPQIAQPIGYPAWWLETFGLDANIMPKWGQPANTPPLFYELYGPGPFEHIPQKAEDFTTPEKSSGRGSTTSVATPITAMSVASAVARYGAVFLVGWLAGTGRLRLRRGARSGNGVVTCDEATGGHYVTAPGA